VELANLAKQADGARRHLANLNAWARYLPDLDRNLLVEAIEEFRSALEELSTAEEELRLQNEELATAQTLIDAERQRFQDLFDNAPDGYLVTDLQGTIEQANVTATRLLATPAQFLVGKPVAVIVAEGERSAFRSRLNRLRQGEIHQRWDTQLRTSRDDFIEVEISVAGQRDTEGRIGSLRWLLRDVTERRKLEGQIRHLQKIEAFGQLTGGVVHDFSFLLPAQQARFKNKLIADLLLGHLGTEGDSVPFAAEIFGIDLTQPRVAVAIDAEPAIAHLVLESAGRQSARRLISREINLERVRATLADHILSFPSACATDVVGFVDDRWLAVLAIIDVETVERDRYHFAQRVHHFLDDIAERYGVRLGAGIGRYYEGWPDLARSFVDAQTAAEKGTRLGGPGRVFSIEELGLAGFLVENDDAHRNELAQRVLQPLDDEPELLETLDVFLNSNLSPSVASKRLSVHRHTLTYRLRKITRLTRLDPQKFKDAAHLHAALLLRKASRSSG
jgi:PAS domain S-box-containing protein